MAIWSKNDKHNIGLVIGGRTPENDTGVEDKRKRKIGDTCDLRKAISFSKQNVPQNLVS